MMSSMILYTCATKHFQNNPLTSLALYKKMTPKQVLANENVKYYFDESYIVVKHDPNHDNRRILHTP